VLKLKTYSITRRGPSNGLSNIWKSLLFFCYFFFVKFKNYSTDVFFVYFNLGMGLFLISTTQCSFTALFLYAFTESWSNVNVAFGRSPALTTDVWRGCCCFVVECICKPTSPDPRPPPCLHPSNPPSLLRGVYQAPPRESLVTVARHRAPQRRGQTTRCVSLFLFASNYANATCEMVSGMLPRQNSHPLDAQ
jgi:hypothetical protein